MEPLTLVRAWMWDLHRLGIPVSQAAAREAERVVLLAQEAGAPAGAGIALARDVLRRERSARA
jgi:hypothetical protein